MELLKAANLALALLVEVLMLIAFGAWGLGLAAPAPWPWVAGALAVGLGIALWGIWAAPRSAQRLAMPGLVWFKLGMFGLASLALLAIGRPLLALGFAAAAGLNLLLAGLWRQL